MMTTGNIITARPADCWILWRSYLFVCKADVVMYYGLNCKEQPKKDWMLFPNEKIVEMSKEDDRLYITTEKNKYEIKRVKDLDVMFRARSCKR